MAVPIVRRTEDENAGLEQLLSMLMMGADQGEQPGMGRRSAEEELPWQEEPWEPGPPEWRPKPPPPPWDFGPGPSRALPPQWPGPGAPGPGPAGPGPAGPGPSGSAAGRRGFTISTPVGEVDPRFFLAVKHMDQERRNQAINPGLFKTSGILSGAQGSPIVLDPGGRVTALKKLLDPTLGDASGR